MAIDYDKLSLEDLKALKAGNYDGVSLQGLKYLQTQGGGSNKPTSTPKGVLKEETQKMSGPSRFITGVGGGMYGLGLGTTQLLAETGNKISPNLVSNDTVSNLRNQGQEHQSLMNSLKMEQPGLGNPASWGEFVGETAPTLVGGGFGAKALSKAPLIKSIGSNILRNSLVGGATGTLAGAASGITQPVGPQDSRTANTITGAVSGGLGGAVLGGAGGLGQSSFEAVRGMTGPLNSRIDFYLRKVAPYSPSRYLKLDDRKAAIEKRSEGVQNLYKLRDEISLPDETGAAIKGKLPETQFEFLEAINQGKHRLFEMYDSIAAKATQGGLKVKPNEVQAKLSSIIEDTSGSYTSAQKLYARKMMRDFMQDFTPRGAQERIAGMNETLANYYSNKDVSFAKNARIEKEVLDTFRKSLTNTIENAGEEYAPLRKAWGSVNELEADAIRKFERDLMSKSKSDPLNFLAAEQVLYAVAKGNPKWLIPATGTVALKTLRSYFTSPNRAVKSMFREVAKELKDERILDPSLPTPRPVTPAGAPPQRGIAAPQTPIEGEIIHAPGQGQIQGQAQRQLPPGQGFTMQNNRHPNVSPTPPTAANAQQNLRTNRTLPSQADVSPNIDLGHMIYTLRQKGMSDKEIAAFVKQEYEAAILRMKGRP